MSSKPLRILAAGDVEGHFEQLFKRVESIQKKSGNFDLLLCVGDFFGTNLSSWEPYKSGKVKVPISTLILGPSKPELGIFYDGRAGTEMCEGITYLGKSGRFTGSSGLQIAYLSGVESQSSKEDDHAFTPSSLTALTSPVINDTSFKGIDILMTSQWPKGVEKYGTQSNRESEKHPGSSCIAELARILKPRYHFAGLEGIFYERQPYRNHQVLLESARHTTRFIGLANVTNTEKQKYLYAFNIVPMKQMNSAELVKQPEDVTECPYTPSNILTAKQEDSSQQFFYDMKAGPELRGRKRGGGQGQDRTPRDRDRDEKKPKKEVQPAGPCWFCLGSPQVEKHLVVSVSDKVYLALAKGGLVEDHVLILPVQHHQSLVSCPEEVLKQIDQYKKCLQKMFKSQGKSVVFFERNFKTQHLQIQVVPIPLDSVVDVRDTFVACAETESIELAELPALSDLKQIVPDGVPYFYLELPTGEKFLHRISRSAPFPLQFGREALCEPAILNMPERVDWKNCQVDKEEESEMAAKFKSQFKAFDFNFQ